MEKANIHQNNYIAIHSWLRNHYGSAQKCEGKDCNGKSKKYEWSLIKGKKYAKKRDNFMSLCASCHRKYDMTEEKLKKLKEGNKNIKKTHCPAGHEYTEDNTYYHISKKTLWKGRQCRICDRERSRQWARENTRTKWKRAFLEAEIARLEGMKKGESEIWSDVGVKEHNQALQDQISHFQELLEILKR